MDEPPFATVRLALPASILAKGGSFFRINARAIFAHKHSLWFLYEEKKGIFAEHSADMPFFDLKPVCDNNIVGISLQEQNQEAHTTDYLPQKRYTADYQSNSQ